MLHILIWMRLLHFLVFMMDMEVRLENVWLLGLMLMIVNTLEQIAFHVAMSLTSYASRYPF